MFDDFASLDSITRVPPFLAAGTTKATRGHEATLARPCGGRRWRYRLSNSGGRCMPPRTNPSGASDPGALTSCRGRWTPASALVTSIAGYENPAAAALVAAK